MCTKTIHRHEHLQIFSICKYQRANSIHCFKTSLCAVLISPRRPSCSPQDWARLHRSVTHGAGYKMSSTEVMSMPRLVVTWIRLVSHRLDAVASLDVVCTTKRGCYARSNGTGLDICCFHIPLWRFWILLVGLCVCPCLWDCLYWAVERWTLAKNVFISLRNLAMTTSHLTVHTSRFIRSDTNLFGLLPLLAMRWSCFVLKNTRSIETRKTSPHFRDTIINKTINKI